MADCPHKDFVARVEVSRFEDKPGVFAADLRVECAECGRGMQFHGMPMGLLWDQPTMSVDGLEARLPMRPFVKPEWLSEDAHRLMTQ